MAKLHGGPDIYVFHCPGCKFGHRIPVNPDNKSNPGMAWQFNGDINKPTFSPSYVLHTQEEDGSEGLCHSFIADGRIQFLGDCTHELAGQTVELPEWDLKE